MRIYDHFSISVKVTQITLCTIYFDSTGGATALLSDYAVAVSETIQEPWWSFSSLYTL